MDEQWNDNQWVEDAQMYEQESILAEMHDLEAEKVQLKAQIAELEADIIYQSRLHSLGRLFHLPTLNCSPLAINKQLPPLPSDRSVYSRKSKAKSLQSSKMGTSMKQNYSSKINATPTLSDM